MPVYLYVHSFEDAHEGVTQLRQNALWSLRHECSRLPGFIVSAVPCRADLEVGIVNVIAADANAVTGRTSQRILVVRMTCSGERHDFVCSDGPGAQTAERQAARRLRNWVAGENLMSSAGTEVALVRCA